MTDNAPVAEPDDLHVNYDEDDVASALASETEGGPGDLDALPESDFEGFSEGDVEEADESE